MCGAFWAAAQGALIVYVAMAALYAWHMNRVDRELDSETPDAETHPAPPTNPTGRS